jgi:tripartite-type tricarboxylate transporter receptor subunit TctC
MAASGTLMGRGTVMPRCLISIAFVVLSTATVLAQGWPEKPVKIVVAYPPGGATDFLARLLADRLSGVLGQAFVVENRGGAGGMIGANAVAKAAPDGHTLLVCSTAEIAINQSVYRKMSYDPSTDLAPITLIAWTPLIVVAHPSLNASNPAEFIALLKTKPGEMNYASPAVGSAQHLAGEYLKKIADVDIRHIAYRGAGPAVQDVVSGQVQIMIAGVPPVIELVKFGDLRAIAATSAKRSPLLADTPALAELGDAYRDFDITNWFGVLTPSGVPEPIQRRIYEATIKALAEPTVQRRIAEQGANLVANTPQEFAAFIRAETDKYTRIVGATGIRLAD